MQISMDDLELPCWECEGTGKVSTSQTVGPCSKCGGTGTIETALGQTLLAFVKKHLQQDS